MNARYVCAEWSRPSPLFLRWRCRRSWQCLQRTPVSAAASARAPAARARSQRRLRRRPHRARRSPSIVHSPSPAPTPARSPADCSTAVAASSTGRAAACSAGLRRAFSAPACFEEIEASDSRTFLAAMMSVYLGSYDAGRDTHGRFGAIACQGSAATGYAIAIIGR